MHFAHIISVMRIFAIFLAALSLLSLWATGVDYEVKSRLIDILVSGYRATIEAAFEPFEPWLILVLKLVWPDIVLNSHWKLFLVPLGLYIVRALYEMWGRGVIYVSLAIMVSSLTLALTSLLAGAYAKEDIRVFLYPVLAFVAYDLAIAVLDAFRWRGHFARDWISIFREYALWLPGADLAILALTLLLGSMIGTLQKESSWLLLLLIFVPLVSFRSLLRAAYIATVYKAPDSTWWRSFRGAKSFSLGTGILLSWCLAFLVAVADKNVDLVRELFPLIPV